MKFKTGRMIQVREEKTPSQIYKLNSEIIKRVLEEAISSGRYKQEVEFRPHLKGESVLFTFGRIEVATIDANEYEPRFVLKPQKEQSFRTAEDLGWE